MIERITLDPEICHGKPCIRGLRYPVETVLEWLSSGMTIADILEDYEDIGQEDILAVLSFADRLAQTIGPALQEYDYVELTRTTLIEHS